MADSTGSMKLQETFGQLFAHLREVGYAWEPLIPERLQACRKDAQSYDPLTRFFGLGHEAGPGELEGEGLARELALRLTELRPAVSRLGEVFVPHHHWSDAASNGDFVYLGRESLELLARLEERRDRIRGRTVLDLGSGSGALSLGLAAHARRVLGLELSASAVAWAQASARAQGIGNVEFRQARLGIPEADRAAGPEPWEVAVFNPPMAVPSCGQRPFRDGGRLGMEVPLLFLDFARRHLVVGGEVFCLATNPIVRGRPAFFDRLERSRWRIAARQLIEERFNRSLYRKEAYAAQGIERVELWFLQLVRL